jgi:hypothetical protein
MQVNDRMKLQVIIDSDLDLQVRVKSAENRQTLSDFVAEGLRYYLKNYSRVQATKKKQAETETEY